MKKFFNLESLVTLRREVHKHAEIYFKEFETQRRIEKYLASLNISEDSIKKCASTGLVVDVRGEGPSSGNQKIVAFRADIDALPVSEDHSTLEYKSVTGNSHLCGHDGHIVCLLGGLALFLERRDKIPSDHILRLLFQPAEEFEGGAKKMVEEGALEGVNEVWGMHNLPIDPPNKIFAKAGVMSSGAEGVKVIIEGKGGHSSIKSELNDPILPLCEINVEANRVLEEDFKEINNKDLIFSLLRFTTSDAHNVIPNTATAEGLIRYYDKDAHRDFKEKFSKIIEDTCSKCCVKGSTEQLCHYPVIMNDPRLLEELKRITEVSEENCPMKASEDFSEFSNVVPGCFFFYAIGKKSGEWIHVKGYDFNDEVIEPASELWAKIMIDRLG